MTRMDGARREINRLRARILERDFRAGAPPLDADGLPNWGGSEPLSVEGYMTAMGFAPDAELTPQELATRERLSPYREVFSRLDETEKAEVGP